MMKTMGHYRIKIEGVVQGVGFRPFVFNLARSMNLKGWVNNDTQGVNIEIESTKEVCDQFLQRLRDEKPPLSQIRQVTVSCLSRPLNGSLSRCLNEQTIADPESAPTPDFSGGLFSDFCIRASTEEVGSPRAEILPDLSTCPECLAEVSDPSNRRYRYLFANCTFCGPRFSIVQRLPYDRKNTTMDSFILCEACYREYTDPTDRRFHAQPNACPDCGPEVFLQAGDQTVMAQGFASVEKGVQLLRQGHILAIKGLGGYQLVVDATQERVVQELRRRKGRKRKPFAIMVPSVDWAHSLCHISAMEAAQLTSPAAPIVILDRKAAPCMAAGAPFPGKQLVSSVVPTVAPSVAPGHPSLGLFLPNTPLHFWLLQLFEGPLVVTSANLSEEPLVYQEPDVFERLKTLADFYLVHNRPIARPIDDSVVQVVEGRVLTLRAARGLAPVILRQGSPRKSEGESRRGTGAEEVAGAAEGASAGAGAAVGVGAQMKNTFSLGFEDHLILSQHLGDMESDLSQALFERELNLFFQFYQREPEILIRDRHPGYFTSEWAEGESLRRHVPVLSVQHHRAHIYATLAEYPVREPFLGVAWDGTGYGDDGTVWGGELFVRRECLREGEEDLERIGSLYPFRLLGGEAAIRSPWRVALALLFEVEESLAERWFERVLGMDKVPRSNYTVMRQLWRKGEAFSPQCSSMGRLFEGVSSLLGISHENDFEGDAAIQLEAAARSFQKSNGANPRVADRGHLKAEGMGAAEGAMGWVYPSDRSIYIWDWRSWVRDLVNDMLSDPTWPGPGEALLHSGPFFAGSWALDLHLRAVRDLLELVSRSQLSTLVLGGGVFQNRLLLTEMLQQAAKKGVQIVLPSKVPINDGGIALGQMGAEKSLTVL